MSVGIMEERLLVALGADAELAAAGCAAEAGDHVGIILRRGQHYRGAWYWQRDTFSFTPAGYSASTCEARTIDEALAVTRELALK
jgi:hypothetical protein